jgi:phosphohistidine phosphatase
MRTLFFLRHAKSSWDDPALPDRERPLAPRGRRDAKRIGEHFRRLGITPTRARASLFGVRTQETLDLLRPALAEVEVQVEEPLYGASSETLLERIHSVRDEANSVLLIGHNPGLHHLALALASEGAKRERLEAKFPTAALVTLAVECWSSPEPGRRRARRLWFPSNSNQQPRRHRRRR